MLPDIPFITMGWLVIAALAAGGGVWLIFAIVQLVRHPVSSHCARCGYSRSGSKSDVCSECGFAHDQSRFRLGWTRQRHVRRALLGLVILGVASIVLVIRDNWTRFVTDEYLLENAPVYRARVTDRVDELLHQELWRRARHDALNELALRRLVARGLRDPEFAQSFVRTRSTWPAGMPIHFDLPIVTLPTPREVPVTLHFPECGAEIETFIRTARPLVSPSGYSPWRDYTKAVPAGCIDRSNPNFEVILKESGKPNATTLHSFRQPLRITIVDSLEEAVGIVTDDELPLAEHMQLTVSYDAVDYGFSNWHENWRDVALGLRVIVQRGDTVVSRARFWVKWGHQPVYFDPPLPPGTLEDPEVEVIVEPDPEMALCDFSKPRIWMGEPFRVPVNAPSPVR